MRPSIESSPRVRTILLVAAALTTLSCMDIVSAPVQREAAVVDSSGIMTSRTVIPSATGMSIVSLRQRYTLHKALSTQSGSVSFQSIGSNADSMWIPLPPPSLRPTMSSVLSHGNGKSLRGRIGAQRVIGGKTHTLIFADTDGYDAKEPPHLLLLDVDGVRTASFLPKYEKTHGRMTVTGGTFNLYDAHGAVKRSTTFTLSGGIIGASRTTRTRYLADALATSTLNLVRPRALYAQAAVGESCSSEISMGLLDAVLLAVTGPELLGAVSLAFDLTSAVGCGSGGHNVFDGWLLPPVNVTCRPCVQIIVAYADFYDAYDGSYINTLPVYEEYCPPC